MEIHFILPDSERKSLADLQEKGTAYAQLSETEKVQDLFSQIFKELTDRMRKRKEAAVEITEEPWMILLIDDIKNAASYRMIYSCSYTGL